MTSRRQLGLWTAVSLVIANMIGAGVFTTSGFALADLGRPELVLLAWLVGGLVAMCGALSYGALARHMPDSGGEYAFLSKTAHPLAGFLAGWVSLLAGFTAPIAAAALGMQAYLADSFRWTLRPEWIATGAILTAGLMHGFRLRGGVTVQNAAVGLNLVLITGFIAVGVLSRPQHLGSSSGPFDTSDVRLTAFAVTLVWISFAYSGWNAAVYIAGEVRDPERNLPRSLVLGTAVVTVVYLALNTVFLYSVPAAQIAGTAEIGAIAAEALGGARLRRAVSAIVALALFTSICAMVMAGARVYARMAEDGALPRRLIMRPEVPTAAVAVQVGLAVLVVWVSGLTQLLGYIGFTLGLSAAATVGGLIALRHREGPQRVPTPGYPWIPGLFILLTVAAAGFMAARQPFQAAMGVLTLATGVLIYWLMRVASGRGAASTTLDGRLRHENPANHATDLAQVERLGQERRTARLQEPALLGVEHVPGDEDDPLAEHREASFDLVDELHAVHDRHLRVRHD
jgi:amino acid transporter